MHIFNKYASHACMIEHIFKYVYGEKPSWAKEKPRRGDFANVALNSYVLFVFPFFQMLIFLSTTGKFTFENNAKSYQNIRFNNNLVTRFMPEL